MPHALLAQVGVAFAALGQLVPHAPQLLTVLVRLTSQPLLALPSQFPKPAVHVKLHVLEAHTAVALVAPVQTRPHAPQLPVAVVRLTSQPLLALPSQSPKFALQRKPATPAVHVAVAFAGAVAAAPQRPQCATLVSRFVSQPLLALPSQSPKPALHVKPHALDAQTAVAFARLGHAMLQAPQCCGELVVSVHIPLQLGSAPQPLTQPLVASQNGVPPEQRRPHIPQFSTVVIDSQPLAGSESQSS
jgi:hypothetical protein